MLRHVLMSSAVAGLAMAAPAFADAPTVVASIKPVHSLVSAVMQGVGEPTLIVKGAGSPHTYSMRPSEAAALNSADIVFWVGEGLEPFLEQPLETLGEKATVVELAEAHDLVTLPFREGGAFEKHSHGEHEAEGHAHESGHDHEHEAAEDHDHKDHAHEGHTHEAAEHDHAHAHDHGAFDMHLWLDPHNARAWVHEIEEALAKTDPDNAARYEANAAALNDRLNALEKNIAAEVEPAKGKPFIVFHDAYQYFENRFGVQAAGSITVSPEVAPGAQRVAEMRGKVGELGAVCVFAEPQFEPKIIATVTEGTSAKSGVLDPVGADLADGPNLYFELMRGLAGSLTTCLSEAS